MRRAFLCLLGLVLVLAGCGDNELGVEKIRPNQAPETILSSGPPDSTDKTGYRVQLFWSGTDRDGTVSHYDFIMVDHPAMKNHIKDDPDEDDASRVIIEVPEPDDPRWIGTSATDSLFITLADTLHREPRPGSGENNDSVRNAPFERWHTFFVRAVDNEGLPDPTPDYRSFNATNIAPTVRMLRPVVAGAEFSGPPVIVFNWDGEDIVDESNSIDPVASRYVIISTRKDLSGNGYVSFPESLYVLPQRYDWSPWKRWDALDGSGRRAVVSGLNRVGDFAGSGYYIFAVQALDEAGAITPVFDWQSNSKNNVALVRVSGNIGPILTVREDFLGTQTFVGGSRPIQLDIAGGQRINFRWSADATHYGGEIVAYRYGWDIRNPDNDQEWSSWALSNTKATTQSFNTGSHRFFLQVRDNAESITQAIYELTVYTVTRSRDILWVDDSDYLTDLAAENGEDARWVQTLTNVAAANGFQFDPNLDVYDVLLNRNEPPPIQKVFDYKAVVWSNRSGRDGSSGLRRAAQFFDPIPVRNQNTSKAFNFLNIYMANGGAMWISGFRPAKQLWPDERERGREGEPVNVTNWDDPIEPHPPGIDSVGTTSLLYKMGIEMFDVGSATEIRRNGKQHYCYGLRRCSVAGADSQRTTSSVSVSHTHVLTLATQDVEAFVPVSTTYQTSPELEHRHSVTLSAEDFLALQRGETIVVESSESALPQVHSHVFQIVDQLGLWGAPVLATSTNWGQGGTTGRTNIEIYNMPNALLTQRQPLIPLPGISLPLYCFVSGLPENPQTGFFYPETADNQPALVLAKGAPSDPYFTRAFCGFEPYLLETLSHERLTEFIVVRHFRLGQGTN